MARHFHSQRKPRGGRAQSWTDASYLIHCAAVPSSVAYFASVGAPQSRPRVHLRLCGSRLVDFAFALLVDFASAVPLLRNKALEVNLSILSQNVFLQRSLNVPYFAAREHIDERAVLGN